MKDNCILIVLLLDEEVVGFIGLDLLSCGVCLLGTFVKSFVHTGGYKNGKVHASVGSYSNHVIFIFMDIDRNTSFCRMDVVSR